MRRATRVLSEILAAKLTTSGRRRHYGTRARAPGKLPYCQQAAIGLIESHQRKTTPRRGHTGCLAIVFKGRIVSNRFEISIVSSTWPRVDGCRTVISLRGFLLVFPISSCTRLRPRKRASSVTRAGLRSLIILLGNVFIS